MTEEELQAQLRALDVEQHITRILLAELIAQSPEPERLLQRLQSEVDQMCKTAPVNTDPEYLVELLARTRQTVLIARQLLKGASASD